MARLTRNAHTVELTVRKGMDPIAQRRRVANIHRRRNREIDEHNRRILGVVPPETDFVDGRRNAPLETVRLDGGVILTRLSIAQRSAGMDRGTIDRQFAVSHRRLCRLA